MPVNDVGHHARRRRKRREAAIAQSADGGIEDVAATEEAPSAAAAADVQGKRTLYLVGFPIVFLALVIWRKPRMNFKLFQVRG